MPLAEPLTGHCLCGGVRFEITEPLGQAGYCHCTRCQRRTGSGAAASAQIAPGSLRVLTGEELIRSWRPPDGNEKLFCSACGGALFSRAPGAEDMAVVRLGVIDGDPGVRPAYHQHVATTAPWEPLADDGLPRYEGSRPR